MIKKTVILICLTASMVFPVVAEEHEEIDPLRQEDVESPNTGFIRKVKRLKAKKISDLVHLSPFSDVAVIQRRFMPKTGRVSFSLASTFTLSSEFFLNPGLGGHLSYNFLEKHGVELIGYYAFTFNRGVTSDLEKVEAYVSEESPIAKSFFGLTYKWMPIYGKIAFYDESILAFDTYFILGGGMSQITSATGSGRAGPSTTKVVWEPSGVIGIGQIFAITRDLGFRWDLRWQATIRTQEDSSLLSDVLFAIGFSYYYPSAGLR